MVSPPSASPQRLLGEMGGSEHALDRGGSPQHTHTPASPPPSLQAPCSPRLQVTLWGLRGAGTYQQEQKGDLVARMHRVPGAGQWVTPFGVQVFQQLTSGCLARKAGREGKGPRYLGETKDLETLRSASNPLAELRGRSR